MGQYLPPKQVRDALFAGVVKPEYARIPVPVLAFFAAPRPLDEEMRRHPPANAEERAAIEGKLEVDTAIRNKHRRDLRIGVPAARIVELANANFYVFLSNEEELLRELRPFLAALK